MKERKLGTLVLISLSLVMLSSCTKFNKEDDNDTVKEICVKYASEYEILERGEDGSAIVSINAPDFKGIMELIAEEKSDQDITVSDIEKAIEDHPEYKKEYKFEADGEENNEIEKGFLEIISEELIIEAIKNVEYTEEWSVEE